MFLKKCCNLNKTLNNALVLTLNLHENQTTFQYDSFLIEQSGYKGKYKLFIIEDIKDKLEKFHDIRHDIKNKLNPLTLLDHPRIDVQAIIKTISDDIDNIAPKGLLY